jgi:hypothetical protein
MPSYNSQLDAFERYHLYRDNSNGTSATDLLSAAIPSPALLEALGHALSGAAGAAISNVATYPLDLIITRLQIQRQLQNAKEDGDAEVGEGEESGDEYYRGFVDAVRKITRKDGYKGLWRGVDSDTVKTMLDVGGFFLVYTFLRQRLSKRREGGRLGAVEELAVGWVSGAMVKAVVMPCSVVVAKAQTRGMGGGGNSKEAGGMMEIARGIYEEKGLKGLWAGYQAAMILTLNPSLTFALHAVLSRSLPRKLREKPGAVTTFLLSATSKAIASATMYPFSLAKTRLMVGGKKEEKYEKEAEQEVDEKVGGDSEAKKVEKEVLKETLLSTLLAIVEHEGYSGLYEGLELEVCKGFLSHGITMVAKQIVQRFVIKLWYLFSVVMKRYRRKLDGGRLKQKAKENVEYYNLAMGRAGEKIEDAVKETAAWAKEKAHETAEFVHEYVEEETIEWRSLYGELDISSWLTGDRKESKD